MGIQQPQQQQGQGLFNQNLNTSTVINPGTTGGLFNPGQAQGKIYAKRCFY